MPLDVLVFYNPYCPRCKPMREKVARAKKILGRDVRFYWMNTAKPSVQTIMRRKYPCITRIPSVVAAGDIYWVGLPDQTDFTGVLAYLMLHPEGGKGAFVDE